METIPNSIHVTAGSCPSILSVIGNDSLLRKKARTDGGEWSGPCPFCGGRDRFLVWPEDARAKDRRGRFWCRQCGRSGDVIAYLRMKDGIGFQEACRKLGVGGDVPSVALPKTAEKEPPYYLDRWRARASEFVEDSEYCLWSPEGTKALAWLLARGLSADTLTQAKIGFNPKDRTDARDSWGLVEREDPWLPKGVVIPYMQSGQYRKVQVRRPDNEPKYYSIPGSQNVPFGIDELGNGKPVVVTEGVFNALVFHQRCNGICSAIAIGASTSCREDLWVAAFQKAPRVMLAFDADAAGDAAAKWWTQKLTNAIRWRPYWGDVNDMALAGVDIRSRVVCALER